MKGEAVQCSEMHCSDQVKKIFVHRVCTRKASKLSTSPNHGISPVQSSRSHSGLATPPPVCSTTPILLFSSKCPSRICVGSTLLGCVEDVAARNGAGVHLVVDHLQLGEADDLEGGFDEAAGEEVDGFGAVFTVAYV